MVLITLAMVQAKVNLDTMKEMMVDMNQRLAKTEAELAATKDELTATKDKLAATKDDLKERTGELEREVAILRNPPYIHACGSHCDGLSGSYMTIPYTSLLYSSTNTEGHYYGGLHSPSWRILHCVLGYYCLP